MKKIILSFVIALSFNSFLKAQDGVPDNTFGVGGQTTTSFGGYSADEINDIALQTDGKIVVLGVTTTSTSGIQMISLARYNTNGSLDNTFGTSGLVTTTTLANHDHSAIALKIQTDGKIVVAGDLNDTATIAPQIGKFIVLRYNSNGSLDNTFSTNGIKSIQATGAISVQVTTTDLVLQPDGKMVISGIAYYTTNGEFVFIRLNANGSLDNTFGTNGLSIITPTIGTAAAEAMALQSDGKIAFSGFIDNSTSNAPFVSRLNTNGAVDLSFGTNGFVLPTYSSSSAFMGITLDPSGNIYACGVDNNGSLISKFTSTGAVDNTFGTSGYLITAVGTQSNEILYDVIIQSDLKVVACGSADGNFDVIRTTTLGSLDASFGTAGIVTTTFTPGIASEARSLKIQADGKIVLGGINITANPTAISTYAMARYTNSSITFIKEDQRLNTLDCFPNPASNLVSFTLPQTNEPLQLKIIDNYGKLVLVKTIDPENSTISVSELHAGIYFVTLYGASTHFTQKLVIVH